LEAEADIDVVDTTDNGLHAILLAQTSRPDVVVTGLDLLSLGGIELIRRLRRLDGAHERPPQIIAYAMEAHDEIITEVLHAGASGLLVHTSGHDDLATAIRVVAGGEVMLASAVAKRLVDWFRRRNNRSEMALGPVVSTLTRREREVLLLLAEGLQPEEIADKLFIGETTVRTHLYRLRNKLSLNDRAQLVSFAFRAGLMHRPMAGR
ncbi:MAG: LuxR C-terminal-related transcriptional regulator, partial [Micromonosporaceae bacterium]